MVGGKPDKAAKAAAKAARRQQSKQRRQQLWQAFHLQRKEDPWLLPLMIGAVLGVTLVVFAVGWLVGAPWVALPTGLLLGVLLAVVIFSRRVQRTAYRKAEGQAGAAAWVLENLQGKWRVSTGVAATAGLDAVHRVIGLPGVIFVGEGTPHRVKNLLAQEKKRAARLVGDTPIYTISVGKDTEEQIPIDRLQRHLTKLPRNIDTKRVDQLDSRLKALGARTKGPTMPKGPLPPGAKARGGMQRTIRRR